MRKLVYHLPEMQTSQEDENHFYNALNEVIAGDVLKIACPYLNLDILEALLQHSNENWQLITDINAWIESIKSQSKQMSNVIDFIHMHAQKIRHCHKLHAKVIIGEHKALFGSANFTDNGLRRNNELSLLLSDTESLTELSDWFHAWWNHSEQIDLNKLKARVQNLITLESDYKKLTVIKQLTELTQELRQCSAVKTRGKHFAKSLKVGVQSSVIQASQSNDLQTPHHESEYQDILSFIKKHHNLQWVREFFRLLNTALLLLKHDDYEGKYANNTRYLYLILNPEKREVSLMINHRVLIYTTKIKNKIIGLMMPLEFMLLVPKYQSIIKKIGRFKRKKVVELLFVYFYIDDVSLLNDEIISYWKKAIEIEKSYPVHRRYEKNHRPLLYDIIATQENLDAFFEKINSEYRLV